MDWASLVIKVLLALLEVSGPLFQNKQRHDKLKMAITNVLMEQQAETARKGMELGQDMKDQNDTLKDQTEKDREQLKGDEDGNDND